MSSCSELGLPNSLSRFDILSEKMFENSSSIVFQNSSIRGHSRSRCSKVWFGVVHKKQLLSSRYPNLNSCLFAYTSPCVSFQWNARNLVLVVNWNGILYRVAQSSLLSLYCSVFLDLNGCVLLRILLIRMLYISLHFIFSKEYGVI